jgi:hypothetical protein
LIRDRNAIGNTNGCIYITANLKLIILFNRIKIPNRVGYDAMGKGLRMARRSCQPIALWGSGWYGGWWVVDEGHLSNRLCEADYSSAVAISLLLLIVC